MRRILFPLLVIGLAAGLFTLGSGAYFSDTESSTGNTITVGTLNLDCNVGVTACSTAGRFVATGLAPGAATSSVQFDLKNSGSLSADHVEFAIATSATDNASSCTGINTSPACANDTDVTDDMYFSTLTYGATNLLAVSGGAFVNATIEAADTNNNQKLELSEANGLSLDGLAAPAANNGSTVSVTAAVTLDSNAANGVQGDVANITFTFTLNQDASQ